MNLLRLLGVALALPGRLVIGWLNSISYPKLTRPLRVSVHALVWIIALMTFSFTLVPPPGRAPVATYVAPTHVPRPVPTFEVDEPAPPTSTDSASEVVVPDLPDIDEDVVEHENDDDHWHKPRYCYRHWWC